MLVIPDNHLNITSQHSSCTSNITVTVFIILSLIKRFNFLKEKLRLGSLSSDLNEVIEQGLLIQCRKLPNIQDF